MSGTPTLLGVPFDGASSWRRGPARGPAAIREALRAPSSNTWTEDGLDITAPGVLADGGDVELLSDDGAAARSAIEAAVGRILDAGGRPLVLGGDHSITYPVLRAVGPRFPGLTVLHFDAHSDLYHDFEGDPYSHACPFARVMEQGFAVRLLQFGIRTLSRHQREQAAKFAVEIREMRHWTGPESVSVAGPVYLSLDLDALDPAFIAGINHPEPGGLSVRDVETMIQRLEGRLVGAGGVDLSPPVVLSPRSALG
ncbi:MAG: arginase family protein, partial [Gemmatimonadales bacterium]